MSSVPHVTVSKQNILLLDLLYCIHGMWWQPLIIFAQVDGSMSMEPWNQLVAHPNISIYSGCKPISASVSGTWLCSWEQCLRVGCSRLGNDSIANNSSIKSTYICVAHICLQCKTSYGNCFSVCSMKIEVSSIIFSWGTNLHLTFKVEVKFNSQIRCNLHFVSQSMNFRVQIAT